MIKAQDISTVAIIGAGTMGSGIASEFARAGCDVRLVDLGEDLLQRGIKMLRNAQKALIEAELLSARQVEAALERIRPLTSLEMACDQVQLVIEATGIAEGGDIFVLDMGEPVRIMDLAKKMIELKKPGKIINIASGSAFFPIIVGFAAYEASKAGVVMFTKSLALELAPYGITVNAIAPGSVQSEGAGKMWQAITLPEKEKERWGLGLAQRTPLGRQGEPDDIAKGALFLGSNGSDYMTGETIIIDGGFSTTVRLMGI